MKTCILENEFLQVRIEDLGAQLVSAVDKATGSERIWTADPKFWDRHAPILFPFVGSPNGMEYRHNGKTYPMTQHGFARDMLFTCTDEKADSVTHCVRSTPQTLQIYPFSFTLWVTHTLCGRTLQIDWRVQNDGPDTMYFAIGGHPGFLLPPNTDLADCWLSFDKEQFTFIRVATDGPGADPDLVYNARGGEKLFKITRDLFDNDAMIIDGTQIAQVGLYTPDKKPFVCMDCTGFPSLGVWSKPRCAAPFLCLEPWYGRCDNKGFSGELKDRFGEQSLQGGGTFTAGYSFTLHE